MNRQSTRRRFLQQTITTGLALPVCGLAAAPATSVGGEKQARSKTPIDIGSRKQLLIDDAFFASSKDVTLAVNPARKTEENILTREHPWESASINWFTVTRDAGRIDQQAKFRMWYEAYDAAGWYSGDDTSFCYAESRDGIHWTKPELGLFSYQGSTRNNILFRQIGAPGARSRVHGTGVFIDPTASPESRYKAVSQGVFTSKPKPPHRVAGMYSADGLKWTRHSEPICDIFADSQYSGFWDASLKKYVLYGRVGGRGRSLGRSESTDFKQFDPLKLVLQTDDNDPAESDLYNSSVMKYPYADNVYLMFPSLYQHRPDTLDIHMAVSRDGVKWSRPSQDVPFVPLGKPGESDGGSLYAGQGMLRVGDELWTYYSASPLKHEGAELDALIKPENGRYFSRAVTRLDRFVAASAGPAGGEFTTRPLTFTGKTLKLNVDVSKGGSVRVGLLDEKGQPIPGRSSESCLPITGDRIDHTVRWKTGSDVNARANVPTRLHVELKDARLYAFQME